MIVHEASQGTAEWLAARCGIPSASNFDKIITTKGEPSKQAQKYMWQLAGERVTGKPEESYMSAAMQRGVEMEAEARAYYNLINDVEIEQVGVCFPDDKRICAASPDGLVGKDGLVEIKCPVIYTHVGYLLNGGLVEEYFQQVQGGLYVTGRKWTDVISYFPGLRPLVIRVERDEAFIRKLAIELELFAKQLDTVTEKIR